MTVAGQVTLEAMIDSLTGFEESAIGKAFDVEFGELFTDENRGNVMQRALVFVAHTRQGLDDKQAKEAALAMTLGEVNRFFLDDVEPNPADPITEQGKGGSASG